MSFTRFSIYSWSVLVYNLGVILWGAYVRATGSGAGCGSHWPLCNGEVIPRAPQIETVIEFSHRLSSGIAFVLVLVMFVWAFRAFPKGHPVRLGASMSLLFITTEALVGAGLVLFEWVADDASTGRAVSMAVHLINTFLLLASMTLTAWWASGGEQATLSGQSGLLFVFCLGFLGVILLGVTGAITALGDTLFPSDSLLDGFMEDLNPASHFLLRLRVWHPVIAITVGVYIIFLAGLLLFLKENPHLKLFASVLIFLFILQLGAGVINLVLLAPVWMQVVHLLLADLVWITFVLLAAVTFVQSESIEERGVIQDLATA
jgi:heme A synthase